MNIVSQSISDDFSGQRVDNYLIRCLKGVPKSFIYRLIRSGKILINGKRVEVNYRLALNDFIRLPPIRHSESGKRCDAVKITTCRTTAKAKIQTFTETNATPFPVIYEDTALLAINKPSGIAVHGGSGISFGVIENLRNFVQYQGIQCPYLELVHRLDKDTSGILLLAKKRSMLLELHKQMRDRVVKKKYFACVSGDSFGDTQRLIIQMPLRKYVTDSGEKRVLVDWENGQFSETKVLMRRKIGNFVFLEAELKTGRTHQIRAHLAAIGMPIVGDEKYGDFALNKKLIHSLNGHKNLFGSIYRMFLHAHFLKFFHPVKQDWVTLSCNLPLECESFLKFLAKGM